jgi:hypothetical protein
VIKTTCSTCIFNLQTKLHGTGVACALNRFETFQKRGEVCIDGVSINRLCSACRDENWGKGKTFDCAIEEVKKNLQSVYSFMIIDREEGDVLTRLKESLSERQIIEPRQIVFAYLSDYSMSEISKFLVEYTANTNIRYNIIKVLEETYEREIFDIAAKSITGMFYTIIENGKKLPTNLIETLYNTIEHKLEKIAVITGKTLHGFTVLTKLHISVNGNRDNFIEDKLLTLSDDASNIEMIKNWGQFYNDIESLKRLGIE